MLEKNRGNNNGIPLSGIGFVIIPNGSNIAEYIQKCYRNSSISIDGGYGCTAMHNVKITIEALNKIKFPTYGEFGSPVVWIRESFTNRPIVIGVLHNSGESNPVELFQQRISQETINQITEIFLDAINSRLLISALGSENMPSEVIIKASSKYHKGDAIKLISKDVIRQEGKQMEILLTDNFNLKINDGLKEILTIKGNTESFELKDQWGNYINFNGESVELKDQWENSVTLNEENVKVLTKKFNVGEGSEQMVLGNKLVSILGRLIDAITALTVVTSTGPSGTPLNSAQFTQIKSELNTILSELSNTD